MGESQIDELSKALAQTTSRRGALKVLATTAAGGAVTLFGASSASARQCRDLGSPCRSNADCCSRYCPSDSYVCSCPTGLEPCQGTCVQTCPGQTVLNPTTCQCECPSGTTVCGNSTCCPPGQICFNGACRAGCSSGTPCGQTACCTGSQVCNGVACLNICQGPPGACTAPTTCCAGQGIFAGQGQCCPPNTTCQHGFFGEPQCL